MTYSCASSLGICDQINYAVRKIFMWRDQDLRWIQIFLGWVELPCTIVDIADVTAETIQNAWSSGLIRIRGLAWPDYNTIIKIKQNWTSTHLCHSQTKQHLLSHSWYPSVGWRCRHALRNSYSSSLLYLTYKRILVSIVQTGYCAWLSTRAASCVSVMHHW